MLVMFFYILGVMGGDFAHSFTIFSIENRFQGCLEGRREGAFGDRFRRRFASFRAFWPSGPKNSTMGAGRDDDDVDVEDDDGDDDADAWW